MQWNDQAIILKTSKYSESSGIVSVLTKNHGRFKGLVRSITSPKNRGTYQSGNLVQTSWRARISEQLGNFTSELTTPFASYCMDDALAITAISSLCTLLDTTLPERDPHPELFDATYELLCQILQDERWIVDYIYFELFLLQALGFSLELHHCAVTNQTDHLIYVSPKSGKAVSRNAGLPYHHKLLPLPGFLIDRSKPITILDLNHALQLSAYFLNKYVFQPHGLLLPAARAQLPSLLVEPQLLHTT